jgi:hypothetical protein
LTLVRFNLFFCFYAISSCACKCYRVIWYSFSSKTFFFFSFVGFFKAFQIIAKIYSSNSPIPNMSKHLLFLLFLNQCCHMLPKAPCCCLWKNNASIHFLFVASQILDFWLKSCSFSSCDFNRDVLPLSSSFSSCSFVMITLTFYSTSTLFFL